MLMRASPRNVRVARALRRRRGSSPRLFTPGAVSTPDDTSTPGAPLMRDRARDIVRVQSAGQQPGPRESPSTEQSASRTPRHGRRARVAPPAPWRRTAACRRRFHSRAALARSDASAIATALMIGIPKRDAQFADALRRLAAVELEEVRPHGFTIVVNLFVPRIGEQRDKTQSSTHESPPMLRPGRATGCAAICGWNTRPRKIRAGAHRRIRGFHAVYAADFDLNAHWFRLIALRLIEIKQSSFDIISMR